MEFLFGKEFKKNPWLAVAFFALGFIVGLGAFKYGSSFFNADVVLRGSYIYKSDIESTHIPLQRYSAVSEELRAYKSENESMRRDVEYLRAAQSAMSTSVCQRFAIEINNLTAEQQRTEILIQNMLSPFNSFSYKSEDQINADRIRVAESRKYSEQLNSQLIQVRNEISKCNR